MEPKKYRKLLRACKKPWVKNQITLKFLPRIQNTKGYWRQLVYQDMGAPKLIPLSEFNPCPVDKTVKSVEKKSKFSDDARRAISLALTGRKKSEETKQKMRDTKAAKREQREKK